MPVLKSRRTGQDLRKHPLVSPTVERLKAAAIERDGKVYEGFKSHYQLRGSINEDGNGDRRQRGDVEGFVTTQGRFVGRHEAKDIAIAAGQIGSMWKNAGRELLSSDIDW